MNKLPISASDLVGHLAAATDQLDLVAGDGSFIKLHKGGFWVYGSDDTEVEPDSLWAVNPASFVIGFICWPKGDTLGAPLDEEMRSISQGPVLKSELATHEGGDWAQQVGMQLMCISGEDVGTEVIYKASTKGALKHFNAFLSEVLTYLKANAGTDKVVPVVDLLVGSYNHPKFSTVYTPNFKIEKWATMDEMPDSDDEYDDAEEEEEELEEEIIIEKPAPKKKRKAKALAAPAGEETPAPPPKRRRRRSKG